MDVTISALRAELASWIQRVRNGEEVVVTDRGEPVVRLVQVDAAPLLDELVQRGVLSKPTGRTRPTARAAERAHASGSVSEYVGAERR